MSRYGHRWRRCRRAFLGPSPVLGQTVLMGSAAYGDWRSDAPGVTRRIAPADIPAPSESRSVSNAPDIVDRPSTSSLRVPAGFAVTQVAAGLTNPRIVRVAPNGDIFVAESIANRIRVMRAADGATQPQRMEVFARGLDRPFGMGFSRPAQSNGCMSRTPIRSFGSRIGMGTLPRWASRKLWSHKSPKPRPITGRVTWRSAGTGS